MADRTDSAFEADRYLGVYAGIVLDRDDPDRLGRVTVAVDGIVDESNWALPRAGGAKLWGSVHIPPVGADVFVQFINGDINQPIWEPGPFVAAEQFPEHLHPDVSVWGVGPFRLVIDNRPEVQTAVFKIVKVVGTAEEDLCTLEWHALDDAVRLYATSALQIEAGGLVDIDCAGDVQIKGRKVIPTSRPLN